MIPTSRYGRAYGKFLLRTLYRYPSRFQDAVRLGIVGVHFYQLTRDRLAVHEFNKFVTAAAERVREAYERGQQGGRRIATQVLADGRERLRRLPATVREEMRLLYEDLEFTLVEFTGSLESA